MYNLPNSLNNIPPSKKNNFTKISQTVAWYYKNNDSKMRLHSLGAYDNSPGPALRNMQLKGIKLNNWNRLNCGQRNNQTAQF